MQIFRKSITIFSCACLSCGKQCSEWVEKVQTENETTVTSHGGSRSRPCGRAVMDTGWLTIALFADLANSAYF